MKSKPLSPQSNHQILEEASDWFVDFRVGDVDGAARERFDEWLRRSPEHIRAYMEIAKIYVELPSLPPGKIEVEHLIAYAHSDGNVVSFNNATAAQPTGAVSMAAAPPRDPGTGRAGRRPWMRRRFLATAACALTILLASGVWWRTERFPIYATDIGERRSITLVDGSTVDLNARSRIRIEFTSAERHVELLEGQALFQVAKDKRRPFIVQSGAASIRAVGTQFDVYRKSSGTTVTVLEGRVAVYSMVRHETAPNSADTPSQKMEPQRVPPNDPHLEPRAQDRSSQTHSLSGHPTSGSAPLLPAEPSGLAPDSGGTAAVFVGAGEQVTVTPEIIAAPQQADIVATTAWMQRRLIFDGARLSDVVDEFNRYNKRQLVIEAAKLSDFHVSGVYSSTDPASLIRFLREQPGVKITEDENEIHIASP
jgi:transmembrane sensor